jgi:hypothetical protein
MPYGRYLGDPLFFFFNIGEIVRLLATEALLGFSADDVIGRDYDESVMAEEAR